MFSVVMGFFPIRLHSHVRCIWLHQVTIVHVKIAADMWDSLHACIRAVSSTTDSSSSDSRTGIVKGCPEGFPHFPKTVAQQELLLMFAETSLQASGCLVSKKGDYGCKCFSLHLCCPCIAKII
jgi:hypothetical protein